MEGKLEGQNCTVEKLWSQNHAIEKL